MRRSPGGAFLICTGMFGSGPGKAVWNQTAYPTGNPVIDPTGPTSGRRTSIGKKGDRLKGIRRGETEAGDPVNRLKR